MFDPELLLRQLSDLGRQLDAEVDKLATLDMEATGKGCEYQFLREAHEDRIAEAFLEAEGPVDARKMGARLKAVPSRLIAQEAYLEAEKAKSRLRTQQAAIKALHTRIEIGRSLLSHEKAKLALDYYPEPK